MFPGGCLNSAHTQQNPSRAHGLFFCWVYKKNNSLFKSKSRAGMHGLFYCWVVSVHSWKELKQLTTENAAKIQNTLIDFQC